MAPRSTPKPSGNSGRSDVSCGAGSLYLPRDAWAGTPSGRDARLGCAPRGGGGFVVAVFGAGKLGLGGDEAALAGGFEEAGAVTLEVGLGALEGGYRGVEAGELLFDFGDDAVLFGEGWDWG